MSGSSNGRRSDGSPSGGDQAAAARFEARSPAGLSLGDLRPIVDGGAASTRCRGARPNTGAPGRGTTVKIGVASSRVGVCRIGSRGQTAGLPASNRAGTAIAGGPCVALGRERGATESTAGSPRGDAGLAAVSAGADGWGRNLTDGGVVTLSRFEIGGWNCAVVDASSCVGAFTGT